MAWQVPPPEIFSAFRNYFLISEFNQRIVPAILSREEGTLATSLTLGQVAVDADASGAKARRMERLRTTKACGPDAPGLASSPEKASASRGDGDKQIQVTRESAYKS